MKTKCIFTLLLLMLTLTVSAQFELKMKKGQNIETSTLNSSSKPHGEKFSTNTYNKANDRNIVRGSNKDITDSAFYRNFVKRNGWFEGQGQKLSKDELSHLYCYYKFSKKNSAGHWTLMQAYNSYGQLTTQHSYSAYILNQFDDKDKGANREWKEKMQSMCQIELIGSTDGKEVVQERSLDAFGNVVFAAIPTRTGPNTFLYSYIDSWGRPAYIRTDSLGNDLGYANFVEVTRDCRGFDVLFKYTDRNGIPQKNKDGAFMNKKEYDDYGNELKNQSLNVLGNLMIDDFGNCGMEYTYDSYGNMITAMSHNAEWKPESRSETNGRSTLDDRTCGYWFKHDKYGNEIERGFLDTLGMRCSNQYGAYRIVREYDNHGNQIHAVSFDKYGAKIAMDSLGVAEYKNVLKDGYYIYAACLDSEGRLINGDQGYCKKTWTYINDINTEETVYSNEGDSIIITFHFERDSLGNKLRYWYNDDLLRVDSVNQRGEEVLLAWYDLNLKPKNWWGFHRRVSNYKYEPQKRILTQSWFDVEGNWADEENSDGTTNGYTSQILISDTLSHTETKYQFVGKTLKQAFVQENDETMSSVTAQYDITPFGNHSRVGWFDNYHYHAKIELDYNGNIKSFIGTNEFGEPSYLSSLNSDLVYHYYYRNGNINNYFDEDGNLINNDSLSVFYQKLPSVYCVEVTDTAKANLIGLKDNDVIMSYGNWVISKDLMEDKNILYLELILNNLKEKNMTIMRHHPEKGSSEILRIMLPQGSLEQFGFYPHLIYYTKREKQRVVDTAKEYNFKFGSEYKKGAHTIILDVPNKGGVSSTPMYWSYKRKEPYIIVSADQQSPLLGTKNFWFADTGTHEDFTVKRMLRASVNALKHAVLTADLSTSIEEKWEQTMGSTLIYTSISDEDYTKLIKLCNEYKHNIIVDTIPYDWHKYTGKLSIRQLSDSLQTLNDGLVIKENGNVIREDWAELFEPFSRCIVFTFDKDVNNPLNQEAVRLIGNLNKKDYVEVNSKNINSALYIAKKSTRGQGVSNYKEALCVANQYIYIFEGLFTEEQLHRVWGN